jgi:hypothetical protein
MALWAGVNGVSELLVWMRAARAAGMGNARGIVPETKHPRGGEPARVGRNGFVQNHLAGTRTGCVRREGG